MLIWADCFVVDSRWGWGGVALPHMIIFLCVLITGTWALCGYGRDQRLACCTVTLSSSQRRGGQTLFPEWIVSNLVFYAQSTSAVISGRPERIGLESTLWKKTDRPSADHAQWKVDPQPCVGRTNPHPRIKRAGPSSLHIEGCTL